MSSEESQTSSDSNVSGRVTRDQMKRFLSGDHGLLNQDAKALLSGIGEPNIRKLYEFGKSVCRIEIKDSTQPELVGICIGTGFHYGNGWIITNEHVICHGSTKEPMACHATFHFPNRSFEKSKSRTVLFTDFRSVRETCPLLFDRTDLAIIHVPEILDGEPIPALVNPKQRVATEGERIFLIHYGMVKDNGIPTFPQQLSVSATNAQKPVKNKHGINYTVYCANCQGGSSGAPLLALGDSDGNPDFVLVGVHFSGTGEPAPMGSSGWFTGDNWLGGVMSANYKRHHAIQVLQIPNESLPEDEIPNKKKEALLSLVESLKKPQLRAVLPCAEPKPPITVEHDAVIIWKPICNHL